MTTSPSDPTSSPAPDASLYMGPTGRSFTRHPPNPCYALSSDQKHRLPLGILNALSRLPQSALTLLHTVDIPPRDARALTVPAGALVRLSVTHGPQVADVNVWNADNHAECFYASKTRQIHATHLTTGDSLWSNFPYVRPLLTITADSVAYGIDADNAGVHDVIGSRCDPYTHAVITGESIQNTCHSNLTRVIRPYGMNESHVHDVFNAFMCTGFAPDTGVYFSKPSPVRKGDHIDMFAHVEVIVAVSACRQGDVATACGEEGAEPRCFPLRMEVFTVPDRVTEGYRPPSVSSYTGGHGME